MSPRHQTSLPHAALGILAGGLTGTALIFLWPVAGYVMSIVASGGPTVSAGHMPSVMLLVPIAIAVLGTWVLGLVVCAPIPWLLLHVLGLRGWLTAVGLGAIETFVVVLGLSTNGFGLLLGSGKFSAGDANGQTVVDNVLTPYGWQRATESAALLAVAGAVVGFVVWRTAYRRNLTSQEA